jgi:serine/threonine protein kinase
MPSLRDEITKTFRRFGRRGDSHPSAASLAETIVASDPREGKQFGSYRILRRLGVGGMGYVYLALDTRLGRHAALKFLSAQLTADPAMLLRLHQEARTASSLNHPNILTIYDIGEAVGEHFIASEYVEGITVRTALERRLITPQTAIDVTAQVASALIAAHAAGVIHRDLKASNIMIRPDGLVKVIDFGLAKLSSADSAHWYADPLSAQGTIAGTVDYMSPEQARGETVDHRTDLWSLGVVLYEMLSHKLPFDGDTESHVIVGILDHPVPPLPHVANVPRGVAPVLGRALEKDRNRRYQSAGDMLLDVQALTFPSQRKTASRSLALADARKRRRLIPFLVGGLLLACLAIWWWPFHGKDLFLRPSWFEPGAPEQVSFNGHVRSAAISPDGKYLAYTSRETDKETLHILNLPAKTESRMRPFDDHTVALSFSPDSRSIYYVLKDQREWGRLFSISVSPTIPKLVLEDIDGPVTFSPDGKQFAFLRRTEQKRTSLESVMVAQVADTGDQRAIVTKSDIQISTSLAWSPDGKRIAAIIYSEGLNKSLHPTVFFFSPEGALKEQFSDARLRTINGPVWLEHGSVLAFIARTQGETNERMRLHELSVPAAQFREFSTPTLAFDTTSGTRDGNTLAAVRLNRTSSLWIADAGRLDSPSHRRVDPSGLNPFTWSGSDDLIFPSAKAGSVNLWSLAATEKTQPLAAAEACVEQEPVWVPGTSLAVYSSNCSGGSDFNIWQLDMRTGVHSQLTSGSNQDSLPDVTPDGKWIVYTTWPSNIPAIWKVAVGGGTPVPVSNLQARNAAISPDGSSLVCQIRESYDGRWRVAILTLSNGAIRKDFPDLPVGAGTMVRWSPDGRSLDFVDTQNGSSGLWRQPIDGGPMRQLTHLAKGQNMYSFLWNRNGTKLAYLEGRADSDVVLFHRAVRH